MTHIDTSAEACKDVLEKLDRGVMSCGTESDDGTELFYVDGATDDMAEAAALIRQLVRERDEARERALDEAAQMCRDHSMSAISAESAILALKGPKP